MTWETVRLGTAIGAVATGFASRDDFDAGVFQIRMNNLTSESRWDWSRRRRVKPTERQVEASLVEPGDVIFNSTNSPDLVGKSGLMPRLDEPAVISNHFLRIRTRPDRLDPAYLQHWLHQQFSRGVFRAKAKAWINQATLDREVLLGMEIPLPSLPEQRRIAAILDEADALRSLTARRLATLASLTQARHHHILASGAPTSVLADVLDRIESGDSPVCEARPATAGEWGVLKLGAITTGEYLPGENKAINANYMPKPHLAVAAGDLLFSRKNTLEHVGASVYVDDTPPKRLLPDLVFRLVPRDPQIGRALHAYLSLPATRRALSNLAGGSASSMSNISKARLLTLPIPKLAPTAVIEIDALSVATRSAREQAIAQRSQADTLFASLQHRAFRGEL